MKVKDEMLIKALECCVKNNCSYDCPFYHDSCIKCKYSSSEIIKFAFDLIVRLRQENNTLFYKLRGVMHSVDKWLDGKELKQDEVNRAATMREKTLQITEHLNARIKGQKHALFEQQAYTAELQKEIKAAKSETIKEFAKRLRKYKTTITLGQGQYRYKIVTEYCIDHIEKEMVGETNGEELHT